MFVKRRGSAKRKRGTYEALEFTYFLNIEDIKEFLGDFGKVEVNKKDNILCGMWIETRDERKICTDQYLLKDERKNKILTFDPTIFYDWFEQVNYGSAS